MNGFSPSLLFALLMPLWLPTSVAAAPSAPVLTGAVSAQGAWGSRVDLKQDSKLDRYNIHGRFVALAPPQAVWKVLSDYDHLAGIIKSLKSSRVLEREDDTILLEQVVQGRFLFFDKTLTLRLKVLEKKPDRIDFSLASSGPFRFYHGSWTLSPEPGGTCRVDYDLQVSRGDLAPRWLEAGLFRDNALDLLRAMSHEIRRRSLAAAAGPPGANSRREETQKYEATKK